MLNKLLHAVKKAAPVIFTGLAVIGVVGTAVVSAKDTQKAITKETTKEKALCYVPTAVVATATAGSIVAAELLNKRAYNALFGAYVGLDRYIRTYRQKTKEEVGEEVEEKIQSETVRTCASYHLIDCDTPDQKVLWYEPITKTKFYRYEREIIDAEYHFNRNFVNRGCATVAEFCEFLGIDPTEEAKKIGWNTYDLDLYWCDFEHEPSYDVDGREMYVITSYFEPTEDYDRDY